MSKINQTVILSLLTLVSLRVVAAEPTAMELFAEGTELFRKREYAAAAKAFRAAYAARPTWKLYYNIGQSEAAAKHHGRALEAFEFYLSKGGDDVPTDRRQEVMAEIENLRKLVGMLDIQAPAGATVYINGYERGVVPLPGPIPVAASVEHRVHLEMAGVQVDERLVKVMGKHTVIVTFDEKQGPPPEETVDDATELTEEDGLDQDNEAFSRDREPSKRARSIKKWGFVTVGIGSALLVAGAITGGITLAKDRDLVESCDPSCSKERRSDVSTRDALATATDVLLPTGGVAAVVGILMTTVFAKRTERRESGDVALVPFVNKESSGASVQWSF